MGMMKEFKEFAMRGNLIDMAVGVVMGAAFGKVVSGTEVVDQIAKVVTGRRGYHDDVPKDDVLVEKATVL